MGVKRSEYRRSYVRSPDKELASDFEKKFDYRLLRRSEEHRHTPFEWDYTSDSDSEEEFSPQKYDQHKPEQSIEQKYDQRDKQEQTIAQREENDADWVVNGHRRDRVRQRKEKPSTRPRRPLKPGLYRPIPKATPLEPSSKHKIKQEACLDPSVPFVPFGVGDKERSTGALRTHNVRSSSDIYPSALRAKKRHEHGVERREEQARARPLCERRVERFNDKMKRETSVWDSEYKTHYVGFEPGAYKPSRQPSGVKFYVPL